MMKATIEYKRFFAYSEDKNKSFNTEFCSGINIIYGRNTSGKSTLLQAIHYTFGINDEKHKLEEVLSDNVIFRLDFTLKRNLDENISIIRDNDFLYVKREQQPTKRFTGIGANNSQEHTNLKIYLSELFGFNLYLETSGEYKLASLEAMFLPYYVAQDYGWVLTLKSFRGLDFFRNFKQDYYDYYLGIDNEYDRIEKQQLIAEKKTYESEIKFLSQTEQNDEKLFLSKLKDELFVENTVNYISKFIKNKHELIQFEKKYIVDCNKLTLFEEQLSILRRVKSSLKMQNPLEHNCPTCNQHLPNSIETIYSYFQSVEDTNNQIADIKEKIKRMKSLKGEINTYEQKIKAQKEVIAKDYSILLQYKIDDLTYNTWLENKSYLKLLDTILKKIGATTLKLNQVIDKLKKFKTDEEIKIERQNRNYSFRKSFEKYLSDLKVKPFENIIYSSLYEMKLFPKQGVELLQTLLAYYLAFNKTIKDTKYIHRFPLMMDAVFKEDIDDDNKGLILAFIYRNKPIDTQIIISIAESPNSKRTTADYNKAKLIPINVATTRAFLSDYENKYDDYLADTLEIMY